MIDQETLNKINSLLDNNLVEITSHAEIDILKQGYNWSKDFIIACLKGGKKYAGAELYPDIMERHGSYYCIHKPSIFYSKLILIKFVIRENVLVIHISPLNRGSKEGGIYYGL